MKNYILLGLALFSAHLAFAQNNRSKAEVFIQIEDRGNFTVNLDNETITSSKGRFRFFDIYSAAPILSISYGDKVVYNKPIKIRGEERLILSYDVKRGIKIYKTLPIYRNGKYALDNFDQYTEAFNTGVVPPRAENIPNSFQALQLAVKNASFDDAKMDLILIGLKNSELSSAQLITLLKLISDDDKKLKIAKSAYHVIKDPQLFYTVEESFSFLNRQNDFNSYLKIKPSGRPNTQIRGILFDQLKEQVKRESFDEGRTLLIQNTLKDSYLAANQMETLLKLYSFEDAKLSAAKLLYYQIIDKQQYFTTAEAFKFISTRDNFLDFIKNM
jgi:hypothetical protein